MPDFTAFAVPWTVGVVSGLLVSIPVGPINLTIVNEGAQRGFRWAALIGLGSVAMEVIYCFLGFAGFSQFDGQLTRAILELVSFLLMLFLGFKYLLIRSLPVTGKRWAHVETRLHPHTAFMTGFVRVLANPNVLLGWITLSAVFLAHEWISPQWSSKLICISGVAVGSLVWFLLLSYVVARGRRHLTEHMLVRMSQISGGLLLAMAVYIGGRIIKLLAER